MGCGTSSVEPQESIIAEPSPAIIEFGIVASEVKRTWPDIKKIDRLGEKTFAYLLHKYPEFRPFYHIPEAYKSEAELLDTEEIKEPGERFIRWYADIIEHSDTKFDEKIHEKAVELNNQGVGRTQVKHYSNSLVHVINYELQHELTTEEKHSWQIFCTKVSNGLAAELSKFPRKSIV
ncbi:unnamed protein product [Adineta ricciae]|uniref:Globin domain-containing protein n=1 Tax=Adineta ricciae TaxID=249248 RepID=A0A814RF13_ADIRI|nr:unnamed protein product [Adineta ricciae]